MKGKKLIYSEIELAWIEKHKTDSRRLAHAQFCKRFNRGEITLENYKSLCTRKGWSTGRSGRFDPGSVPANKGKKMPYNPNNARTQFKKGNLPHNTRHLGHERITKDGYVEISVEATNPYTGFERRYLLKHRWQWEQEHGPLESGMALKCLDGNKQNTDTSNWEAIPRALLPRLNGKFGRGYDSAAPEVKPAILAVTKLEHRARTLGNRNKKSGEA